MGRTVVKKVEMSMRMQRSRLLVTLGTVVALAGGLVGCQGPAEAFDALADNVLGSAVVTTSVEDALLESRSTLGMPLAGLKHEGVLTVGLRSSAAPPLLFEGYDAKVSGLEIELACAVADELRLPVSFHRVTDVGGALASDCDVVIGVGADEGGPFELVGDFSESAIGLFCLDGSSVATIDELRNMTVGTKDGSGVSDLLYANDFVGQELVFGTLEEAFDALRNQSVGAVLCHASSGAYVARSGFATYAASLNHPVAVGMAIGEGDGELQRAIRDAYASLERRGIVAELRRRWMGELPVLGDETLIAGMKQLPPQQPEDQETVEGFDDGADYGQDGYLDQGEDYGWYADDEWEQQLDGSTAGSNAVVF